MKFALEVVKVKSSTGAHWAIKAVVGKEIRYRGYYYKAEAVISMKIWQDCDSLYFHDREFCHNFNTAEELGITELIKEVRND